MAIQVVIIFPYGGLKNSVEEAVFHEMVFRCLGVLGTPPIIVIESQAQKKAQEKAQEKASSCYKILDTFAQGVIIQHHVWSVDTCQRWLDGWGYIIDNSQDSEISRVVLFPGDTEQIGHLNLNQLTGVVENPDVMDALSSAIIQENFHYPSNVGGLKESTIKKLNSYLESVHDFLQKITDFLLVDRNHQDLPIVIGDFSTGSDMSSKDLIDRYGTLPLIANWFPDTFENLLKIPELDRPQNLGLSKPRSEFLNIDIQTLKILLGYKPFAYEQTLNMVVRWCE
ncbi:MAG: hypothetical protein J7642_17160 [Cyanobacteria bacterium SBC]|nr:hypothetical protein [Cyanobacteria bacterium SBC]